MLSHVHPAVTCAMWILGPAVSGALAVFSMIETINRPPTISYSDFLNQLDAVLNALAPLLRRSR